MSYQATRSIFDALQKEQAFLAIATDFASKAQINALSSYVVRALLGPVRGSAVGLIISHVLADVDWNELAIELKKPTKET